MIELTTWTNTGLSITVLSPVVPRKVISWLFVSYTLHNFCFEVLRFTTFLICCTCFTVTSNDNIAVVCLNYLCVRHDLNFVTMNRHRNAYQHIACTRHLPVAEHSCLCCFYRACCCDYGFISTLLLEFCYDSTGYLFNDQALWVSKFVLLNRINFPHFQ
jgi:hypothetical protein